MALSNADKQALQTWLQANVYKAVRTEYYREGIKDANGKPVYGECIKYDLKTGVDTGEAYYGRTFTLRSHTTIDWREIVRRVWRKAVKNGYPNVDIEQVRDFLEPYADTIKGWAGTNVYSNADVTDAEIDAEDPDA